MKRQIELVRYGTKKSLIKSSVLLFLTTFLISLQFANCSRIYEESNRDVLDDDVKPFNDVNGEFLSLYR